MDKKLPKVFANKIEKKINNNEKVYYGSKSEIKPKVNERNELDVLKQINRIFSSTRYVYKADVVINLKDRVITKKIIGRNKNELITMDNEIIKIDDIINIDFKD